MFIRPLSQLRCNLPRTLRSFVPLPFSLPFSVLSLFLLLSYKIRVSLISTLRACARALSLSLSLSFLADSMYAGLGVYVAPESQTGYQAEGAAKQLNIVQLAIVIVVFGIGLVLAIIGIVFLFINDGDYMKYTIWILPISFVFFVVRWIQREGKSSFNQP